MSVRRSLATMWDTAAEDLPPPLVRSDAKWGVNLEQVGKIKFIEFEDSKYSKTKKIRMVENDK